MIQEDIATRVLAHTLPRLEHVLWTDPWRTMLDGERSQRATQIVRRDTKADEGLVLTRAEG